MRLRKIYRQGHIIDPGLYLRLKKLDNVIFPECGNEFKSNRDWWIMQDRKGLIIAYAGCAYSEGVCIFVRAWVYENYRGKGYQKRMIAARFRAAAKNECKAVVTYTLHDNFHSANNLVKMGFLMFVPEYRYAGKDVIYFRKLL